MAEEPVLRDLRNLKSTEFQIKWNAIHNISKYLQSDLKPDDVRYRMIIKSFLPMTKDPDEKIREIVLSTLLKVLEDKKQTEALVAQSLADSNPGIRSLALEWLRSQNHPSVTKYTIVALSDPSEVVRKTAIETVIKNQFEGIETQLLNMLGTESGGLRRQVIYALGKLKTSQAIGALIDIMQNPEYDDWTRNQASSALDHMEGEGIIEPFLNNLIDPNPYVRETAAAYLNKHKDDILPFILKTSRLDLIGLLQYGTDNTKQDFSSIISSLKKQMEFAFKDLESRIIAKEQIQFAKLADEFQFSEIALKTLIEKVLNLQLIELPNNAYLTETGLLNLLTEEFNTHLSLFLPEIIKKKPFKEVPLVNLEEIIIKIPNLVKLTEKFFIHQNFYTELQEAFSKTGMLNIQNIIEKLSVKKEIIETELIPNLYSEEESWINSKNEFITPEYLDKKIKAILDDKGILSLKRLLHDLSNPKISEQYMIDRINSRYSGTWLKDLKVFISEKQFLYIKKNSSRLDEALVSPLIKTIDIKFPEFLSNLQKVLDVHTYQTRSGTIITMESLHPSLQQEILGKGYINIDDFIKLNDLQTQKESIKPSIMDFINQEFSGRIDPLGKYFFTEDLIMKVKNEIEAQSRLNFNILAYRMELSKDILLILIQQILFVRGFRNKIGEYITDKGIQNELNSILESTQEFKLSEFYDILEITEDREKEDLVREILSEDTRLFITKDQLMFITKKRAINNLFRYLKDPMQQTRDMIPWNELSKAMRLTEEELKAMLNSLVQNQFLPGTIIKNGYKP